MDHPAGAILYDIDNVRSLVLVVTDDEHLLRLEVGPGDNLCKESITVASTRPSTVLFGQPQGKITIGEAVEDGHGGWS